VALADALRTAKWGAGGMRQRTKILAAVGAVAVLVVAGVFVWRSFLHSPQRGISATAAKVGPGRPVPPGAEAAVRLLASAAGRRALTPELKSLIRPGLLFPPGTTFAVQPDSWHQTGAYANLSGTLQIPKRVPVRVEVGLVRRDARWLVTFEGAAQ
jgi:hypothetical protein